MAKIEKIEESKSKEKKHLDELYAKRDELNEKIKVSEKKIESYDMMINQKKFSEVSDVLNATGVSLGEVLEAFKNGNLNSLQEKIKVKNS